MVTTGTSPIDSLVGELPPAFRYDGTGLRPLARPVPTETPLAIFLEEREWVTVLCTPVQLKAFLLGFLFFAEAIDGLDDVLLLRVCDEERTAEIRLRQPERAAGALGRRRMLTSGCAGGTAFDVIREFEPITDATPVMPDEITLAMTTLHRRCEHYRESGGIHGSLLWAEGSVVAMAEDIGRHNTVDKIAGQLLLRGELPRAHSGRLVTTGRISSEMLLKAARLGVPVVVSHTSPTAMAVAFGNRLGITVVGYARGGHFNVYAHPWRIQPPAAGGDDDGER